MTLFDVSDTIQLDLESLEGIRLDRTGAVPIVYAIGASGNEYMVMFGREAAFFEKIKLLERTTETSNQTVRL